MPNRIGCVPVATRDATVFQDAQGQGSGAVETAVKIIRKQPYEKQAFLPFRLITKEE